MNKNKVFVIGRRIALFTIILITITACETTNSNQEKWPELRIGYLPIAAELPLFVAIEKGYFKEAGIKVKLIRMSSSNEMGNTATADGIDILAGSASNVIFDIGHVSGKKHLAFAVNPYSNKLGHITDHLIAKKDSGIKNIADIKGKKLASFPGSVNRIFTYLILEKYGIPRDSYSYSELLPKDWAPSLQSGSIDVVSALEPLATQIIKDNIGTSIFPGFYADLMPDVPLSAHWIAADFYSRADKDQLSAFLNAYEKAIDFCRENDKDARIYLTKYANVRKDILEDVNLNPWQKRSEIDNKKFQDYIDLLAKNKALQAQVNIEDYLLPDPRK